MTASQRRERLRRGWLAIGWVGVAIVSYYSLIPNPPELGVEQGDKVQHLVAYGSLMLWFAQALPTLASRRRAALALTLMGVGLEFAQSLTGYRAYSYADMVANTTGVLLGWLLSPPRVPRMFEGLARRFETPRA